MPLDIQQREVEGIVILDLDGRFVLGNESSLARTTLDGLLENGFKNAILNLEKVTAVDSTGLGVLVYGHSAFKAAGGALKLLNISERHIKLLVLTRLTMLFEIFNEEQQAINSFFPEREVKHFDILEFVRSQEGQKQSLGADSPAPIHSEEPAS